MAQMVKNLPAMQETRVWSLGPEDPLEEGMATHSSILIWRIPRTEEPGVSSPWGLRESDMAEWLTRSLSLNKKEDRSSRPLRRQETESQASVVKPNIQHQWYLVWAPELEITAAWLRAHGFSTHFCGGVAGVPLSVGWAEWKALADWAAVKVVKVSGKSQSSFTQEKMREPQRREGESSRGTERRQRP